MEAEFKKINETLSNKASAICVELRQKIFPVIEYSIINRGKNSINNNDGERESFGFGIDNNDCCHYGGITLNYIAENNDRIELLIRELLEKK